MRFSSYRATYRMAQRCFERDYRRAYSSVRNFSCLLPYVGSRINPLTLRLEDQFSTTRAADLFATSVNGSSLTSPAKDLSVFESSAATEWLVHFLEEYQCCWSVTSANMLRKINMRIKTNPNNIKNLIKKKRMNKNEKERLLLLLFYSFLYRLKTSKTSNLNPLL